MPVRLLKSVIIVVTALICLGWNALGAYRSDRIIVKPKRGVTAARVKAAHDLLRARIRHQYALIGGLQVIELPKGMSVEEAIARYKRSGLFEYVQPDYIRHITLEPDDLYYTNGTLWAMNNTGQDGGTADVDIDAPEAWNVRTDAQWFDGTNTNDVVVAVIDTGVRYTHVDLASNMWVNPCVSCPVNSVVYSNDVHGINAITGSGDPMDDQGHGTHCAGTIGGVGNNGLGVVGVCWHVKIMALKFIASSGEGTDSDAIECINYAIAKGAHIMSNSWGGPGYDLGLRDAIAAARAAGIIFVAAAGNDGSNNDVTPFIPASLDLDNLVSVAAMDRVGDKAGFSNYGRDSVDLLAPGVSITSTYNSGDGSYNVLSGTSMACPHVAGALALVKAQFPSESYTQLIHRVLGTVDTFSNYTNLCLTGGRLNLYNALTQTPKPLANFAARADGGFSVVFHDASMGAITNRTWNFGDGSATSPSPSPTHTYTNAGTYSVTLSVSGPGGSHSRTRSVVVVRNYYMHAMLFGWVDPTGMTALSLTDDSFSSAQTMPFSFVYYGETNTAIYVGSNGLLGFDPTGLNDPLNVDLPNSSAPNDVMCPLWSDLNPGAGGSVYVGSIGFDTNQIEVVSWVGVPHFDDATAVFNFQALVCQHNNDIIFRYQQVTPTNLTLGAGRHATVGLEAPAGSAARLYSVYGSLLLTNSQAIVFRLAPPAPTLTEVAPSSAATNLDVTVLGTCVPLATVQLYTNYDCSGATAALGTADDGGAFNISITVATNSTTTFYATATDTAGGTSSCAGGLTYIHLAPGDDADGDGFTNLQELDAGTSPLSATSFPRIVAFTPHVAVKLQSVAGKTYQLQRRNAMDAGSWHDVGTNLIGDGSLLSISISDKDSRTQRFYRVRITP